MDVVFNLIVMAAIILFILRRMQEVARKGRDITAPPIPRPVPGEPEKTTRPIRRVDAHRRPAPVERRFEVPEAPPEPHRHSPPVPTVRETAVTDEDLLESAGEEYVAPVPFRTVATVRRPVPEPSVIRPPLTVEEPRSRATGGFALSFGRSDLVRGIVMREILGPPAGLSPLR